MAGNTTVSNLALGNHTVGFLPVAGWLAPSNQSVTISWGQTTTVSVVYVPAYAWSTIAGLTNAPGTNDGAAALVVTSERNAEKLGKRPMARIVAQAVSGVEPKWVMMAPVEAVEKLLKKTGWDRDKDVDLVELNEAFAVAAIAVTRMLKLDPAKVNVNGGAVAIGHPIGASGARILVTLLYEMQRRNLKRGIAALCLGGGNAVALAVERP
jgi:acetyl-CoA C-acetyltransferase